MLYLVERCVLTVVCLIKACFEKVKGRFLHAKSRSCDTEFHATKFIYFYITAVCYVKTECNDHCSEIRFVFVWCMLFFINYLDHRSKESIL